MKTKSQTSKEYFKMLSLIYFALIIVQLVFGLMAYIYNVGGGSIVDNGHDLRKTLIYIVPLLVIAGFSGGNIFFKSQLGKIKTKSALVEKMPAYRSALIVRYALLEGPFFFAVVSYLLTQDLIFLGFGALIILAFLTSRPTKEKAILDLELNPKDKERVNDPYAPIAEVKVND